MSNIEITLEGGGVTDVFHNIWDQCEARGLMHIEGLEGWYGGVGSSVVPDIERYRRHGRFPGRTIRGERKITLTLTWIRSIFPSSDNAYTAFARMSSSIAWGEGPYRMTVNEDGFILSTDVQLDGEPIFQPLYPGSEAGFRIRIPLRAQDPFLYAPEAITTVTGYTKTPVQLNNPYGHGLVNADGQQVMAWSMPSQTAEPIINDGTVDSWPTITVVGNSSGGAQLHLGGGSVYYAAPMYEQAPVVLDYYKGTATVNGRDASYNLRRRDWRPIPPGTSLVPRLAFMSDSAYGYAEAANRSTFI